MIYETSDNIRHTATLYSAQMVGHASHFVCRRMLSEIIFMSII